MDSSGADSFIAMVVSASSAARLLLPVVVLQISATVSLSSVLSLSKFVLLDRL